MRRIDTDSFLPPRTRRGELKDRRRLAYRVRKWGVQDCRRPRLQSTGPAPFLSSAHFFVSTFRQIELGSFVFGAFRFHWTRGRIQSCTGREDASNPVLDAGTHPILHWTRGRIQSCTGRGDASNPALDAWTHPILRWTRGRIQSCAGRGDASNPVLDAGTRPILRWTRGRIQSCTGRGDASNPVLDAGTHPIQ